MGGTEMFNYLAIEAALWEREREVREAVRRRRLLGGEGPDPELGRAAVVVRARRRERADHLLRLLTP